MLIGKTALVTGAATGIGKSIATEFSKQRANVVINYMGSADAANQLADALNQDSSRAIAIQADVSNQPEVNQMIQKTIQTFGKIDVLVNNAGIEKKIPFLEKPLEDWKRVIEVDLTGPFICSQAAREKW